MARSSTPPNPFFAAADVIGASSKFFPQGKGKNIEDTVSYIKTTAELFNLDYKVEYDKLVKQHYDPKFLGPKQKRDSRWFDPAYQQRQFQTSVQQLQSAFAKREDVQSFLNAYGRGWAGAIFATDKSAFDAITNIAIESTKDAKKLIIQGKGDSPFKVESQVYIGQDGKEHVAVSRPIAELYGPYIENVFGVVANTPDPKTVQEYSEIDFVGVAYEKADNYTKAIGQLHRAVNDASIPPFQRQAVYSKLRPNVLQGLNESYGLLQAQVDSVYLGLAESINILAAGNFDSRNPGALMARSSLEHGIRSVFGGYLSSALNLGRANNRYGLATSEAFPNGEFAQLNNQRQEEFLEYLEQTRDGLLEQLANIEKADQYEAIKRTTDQRQNEIQRRLAASNAAVDIAVNDRILANPEMIDAMVKGKVKWLEVMLGDLRFSGSPVLRDIYTKGLDYYKQFFTDGQKLEQLETNLSRLAKELGGNSYNLSNVDEVGIENMKASFRGIEQQLEFFSQKADQISQILAQRNKFSASRLTTELNTAVGQLAGNFFELDWQMRQYGVTNKANAELINGAPALKGLVQIHQHMQSIMQDHLGLNAAEFAERLQEWRKDYSLAKKTSGQLAQDITNSVKANFIVQQSGLFNPENISSESGGGASIKLPKAEEVGAMLRGWIDAGYSIFEPLLPEKEEKPTTDDNK